MTISYKWLGEYLPVTVDPDRLAKILTSIGLEVESYEKYEEVKGGLRGLVIGQVLSTEKHPNADKLTLTAVDIGSGSPLQIVCGAPNVAAGQKVVVARVGTTIYPVSGEPMTMKIARIRNVESHGMICAEDEIGLGSSHAGIMVLSDDAKVGTAAADYFQPYEDHIYKIGLTPNRMEAMSHWGVARDVCAYLSHHDRKDFRPKFPAETNIKPGNSSPGIAVEIKNPAACPRYSGISLANVNIGPSPQWLQQKLKSIGLRPINNIVDITNFIQHETGQPLHAFDADKIEGKKIVVKNLPEGTKFTTLDEKERTLSAADLMICDTKKGLCIAGVFGGLNSGVTETTKNIFLESACFEPVTVRRTSFRHGLRTDAASRFEKGTDISVTAKVLKRAAALMQQIAGADIASDIVDVYPGQKEKTQVTIRYHYLKKISGKNYHPDTVKNILAGLGFDIIKEGMDALTVAVPYHKPDIQLAADLVEEILRIDGLDNVEIPAAITITPSVEENYAPEAYREKISAYLSGFGLNEIMTNSITHSTFFTEEELAHAVRLLNNLSAELDIMRPSMLETGLATIAYNLNRKNNNLRFFEFGKTYSTQESHEPVIKKYLEQEHLCLYLTGHSSEDSWKNKAKSVDIYELKGIVTAILRILGLSEEGFEELPGKKMDIAIQGKINGMPVLQLGQVSKKILNRFDIKQAVFYADLNWEWLAAKAAAGKPVFREIPKFPSVQRDLAMVVPEQLRYEEVEQTVQKIRLNKLQAVKLFDIFESEKLGAGKKSMAVNFTFQDNEKTLTDKEIDEWMQAVMTALEKDLRAEIRK